MFDRLITWFTPERRVALAFPAEIALGAFLMLALMLDQAWRGGFLAAVITFTVAVLLGLGVALHRVRPELALASLVASGSIGVFGTLFYGPPINGFVYVAAAIVMFGAAAHGSPGVRWIALAFSGLAALVIFVTGIASSGVFYGVDLGYVVRQATFVLMTSAFALVPWLLGELVRSIRNRRQLSATVATVSTQRDAALTRADLEAERTRVARDVHDIVAHSLTVVIAQADGARYATAGDSPAAADAFETIAQTARDALADVRVLLTELRHTQEAGPQPGLADLDALLDSMRDSGLTLEVREFGDRGRLTESRELALYRIVQESLTNALRHGDGAAAVELEWGDQAVDLVVTNEARGAADEGERGHGIDGMRERASLAGGELSVHDGAMFRVRARLPLEAEPAEVLA
ncbi:MAG: sensor histidine kinase [Microcella sp.]|uniref:histidine kinase n=1 Tax=Microcella sp. TaxID=1913979 RepID=UPI0024C9241D|nr:histidine kinase [Microcella sp.]UYN84080.1 MAG: sensor histidine kinase [Microcella sp.]